MDVVVIGASGIIGQAVVQEALKRKHEVTAAVRNPEAVELQHERLQVVGIDVLDPASVAAAVTGHGEIISAFGPEEGQENDLLKVADSLIEGLQRAGVERLIIVGSAGSLKTESGEWLMDTADFPEELRPLAAAHAHAYEIYRGSALDYTYISPPAAVITGRRTGMFRIGLDRLITDENGESSISVEDLAVAIVDELEEGNFSRERFTVAY
ncbi:3-beta hydroxysteroid dehydrogenase [Paenibacillus sp. FSL R7-0273]|uniref:NAD(P)-dependent oxidoreductase n=1 Tax=Paenibacillus sp. FSL R7-0273 TaxID=1536772 RepID=UPI0004F7A4F3|nr:NAD(P)H-binding protein [Paenibacillus sp. FSL R7-0273]AIQ44804.1 3-beta hydroxysteroid dehydrogenase [Paenibacillus sp. FSL R7-0273]OMF93335.1 3-beta hydroxysteroid dehydrogenase [Paenibacillus sp. FSL R7-0273]